MKKERKQLFHYTTHSDRGKEKSGFVEAADPLSALELAVNSFEDPWDLYLTEIRELSIKNPVVARYLSRRAATEEETKPGRYEWRGDGLYNLNTRRKIPAQPERYELVK